MVSLRYCTATIALFMIIHLDNGADSYEVNCSNLRMGQYICPHPKHIHDFIDPKTQQPRGCTKGNKAKGDLSTFINIP